jgi:hypothetical protein
MSKKSQRDLRAKKKRTAPEPVEDYSDVPEWWRDPWPMPEGFIPSDQRTWLEVPRMGAAEGESK